MNFQRAFSALVAALLVVGTAGFVFIEGWTLPDAIYMTLITLSTVGFGEIQELSLHGRVFTSVLIVFSWVSMACWTAGITSYMVSGQLGGQFKLQREKKMISSMQEHTVVCGGGILAQTILRQLHLAGSPVVAITDDEGEIGLIERMFPDVPIVRDDPKDELALADANLLSAKHLIAATEDDYDNLLITITGKAMGTSVRVMACASTGELASRMNKVGADEVICPQVLGGEHVANLIQEPQHSPTETEKANASMTIG